MDWSPYFPKYFPGDNAKKVEFADIGCGYGGLLGKYFWYDYEKYMDIRELCQKASSVCY